MHDLETFNTTAIVLGGLLMIGALASGLVRRNFLSLAAIFVLAGFILGEGGFEILQFDPRSSFVNSLALVALIIILFRDGLEVDSEMLQKAWHLPLRKLLFSMPITAIVVAVTAKALTDLSWTESFLLGALISPTDPVLSSGVINNPRVPRLIRPALNLESGLNDGLALPAVLAFTAALDSSTNSDFVWWQFILQDISLGLAYGLVVGYLGAKLMPRDSSFLETFPPHAKSLYALGVAFVAFGSTVIEPFGGNGLIAVFVAAIVLGIKRPDLRAAFERRSRDLVEIVKLGVFVVFGSLLTLDGLFADGWGAVAIAISALFVARPIAIWIGLTGTGTSRATKAFMSWFGPRGVSTMTFAILVLSTGIPNGERIFNLAALVVFCSIIAHGLTDAPGVKWIERRSKEGQLTLAD